MSSILDNLPSVIPKNELKLDDVSSVNGGDGKSFIIVHSRDLSSDEKDLFRTYGTVLEWNSSFQNIPLHKLKFDYLLLDINDKQARLLLMKNDTEPYHIVVVCRKWEGLDDFVSEVCCENVVRTLPARSPFKNDWDALLLANKIHAPSCAKAVLRYAMDVFSGCSKK